MLALNLSYGNEAPERGFSINNVLLTKERGSLSERSIVALRVVKEAIRIFGACTDVPITKELLQAVKLAHSEYAVFLEKECKQALLEEEERRKVSRLKKHKELQRKIE